MQAASGEKERGGYTELAQHGQCVFDVTRQIVIEGQRNGRSFLVSRLRVEREDVIDRHKVNDVAERLQLRSEYVHSYRWHNRAAGWRRRSQTVIGEHKTMSADTCERSYCTAHCG